jgi:hypothetical protein
MERARRRLLPNFSEKRAAHHLRSIKNARTRQVCQRHSRIGPAQLGKALDRTPAAVSTATRIELGTFHGLKFGILLHPHSSTDVFLEGAITRFAALSRDHQGPRAVLNALARIEGSYAEQCHKTDQDLAVASQQLRDYQARLGQAFPQEFYLAELMRLRDQLKHALSGQAPSEPSTGELSTQIKTMLADYKKDETPQRSNEQPVSTAEEPITIQLRRRAAVERAPAEEPEQEIAEPKLIIVDPVEPPPPSFHAPDSHSANPIPKPQPGYREQIRPRDRRPQRQLSLF